MNTHDALNLLSLESPGRKTLGTYSRTFRFRRDTVQQYVYTSYFKRFLRLIPWTVWGRKGTIIRPWLSFHQPTKTNCNFPWDFHWDRALGDDFGSGLAACTGSLWSPWLVVRWAIKKRRVGLFFVENSTTSCVQGYLGIMKSNIMGSFAYSTRISSGFNGVSCGSSG